MVRKLFKYEIKSYLRILLPINLIILAVAVFGRIIQFFESDSTVYDIVFGSSMFGLFAGAAVLLVMTVIVVIVRFYKNLFTSEGYLSFTLPVTESQHIAVKLITALLFEFFAVVTLILSAAIMTSGETLVEIIKAIAYLLKSLMGEIGAHLPIYIIEIALLILASAVYNILLYYTCICIGQRAKKNRIFIAVLVYFAYYAIVQIISTVAVIVAALSASTGIYETLLSWIIDYPFTFMHALFGISIAVMAGMCIVWFFITRSTMQNRLNLE